MTTSKALALTAGLLQLLETASPTLQSLIEYLTRAAGADRGMLLACSEQSSQARVLAAANLADANLTLEEFVVSRTVFKQVLRFRQSVLVGNPLADPAYAAQQSIVSSQVRSLLAVPLITRQKVAGILYFDTTQLHKNLSEADRTWLEAIRPLVRFLVRIWSGDSDRAPAGEEVFLDNGKALAGLSGRAPAFLSAVELLKKVAPTPASVLLTGETGTGKELFSRALHALSPRKQGPFVAINCAAIPESLMESELFGHEKGAFTGAGNARPGRIMQANHGTLFLDEVGELKPELQAKLLRFLQSHEVERVGGTSVKVDVRLVAATNQDLAAQVKAGSFRSDLYYRLNVFPISLPPLRDRPGDVRLIAEHLFRKYAEQLSIPQLQIEPALLDALERHPFPGNVRELENVVYRALLLSDSGHVGLEHLPAELKSEESREMGKNPFQHLLQTLPDSYSELCRRREEMKEICRSEIAILERSFAESLVQEADGNVTRAAEAAGIDRGLFYRLLKPTR